MTRASGTFREMYSTLDMHSRTIVDCLALLPLSLPVGTFFNVIQRLPGWQRSNIWDLKVMLRDLHYRERIGWYDQNCCYGDREFSFWILKEKAGNAAFLALAKSLLDFNWSAQDTPPGWQHYIRGQLHLVLGQRQEAISHFVMFSALEPASIRHLQANLDDSAFWRELQPRLDAKASCYLVSNGLVFNTLFLNPAEQLPEQARQLIANEDLDLRLRDMLRECMALFDFYQGRITAGHTGSRPGLFRELLPPLLEFLQGNETTAAKQMKKAGLLTNPSQYRDAADFTFWWTMGTMVLFRGGATYWKTARNLAKKVHQGPSVLAFFGHFLDQVEIFCCKPAETAGKKKYQGQVPGDPGFPLEVLFTALPYAWHQTSLPASLHTALQETCGKAFHNGYGWVEAECLAIFERSGKPTAEQQQRRAELDTRLPWRRLARLFDSAKMWETVLLQLEQGLAGAGAAAPAQTSQAPQLLWQIDFYEAEQVTLQPYLRRWLKAGHWSAPARLSREKRRELLQDTTLDPRDRKLLELVEASSWNYATYPVSAAASALLDHPRLFSDVPKMQGITVKEEQLFLEIKEERGAIGCRLSHRLDRTPPILIKNSASDYALLRPTPKQLWLAGLTGGQLRLPAAARERLLAMIRQLETVLPVHTTLEGTAPSSREVPPDTRLFAHLQHWNEGLKIDFRNQPLGPDGPHFHPGTGPERIWTGTGTDRLTTVRDLPQERQTALQTILELELEMSGAASDWEYYLPDPLGCLEFLARAKEMDWLVLSWSGQEPIRISPQRGFGDLALKVQQDRNWFELSGAIQIDESRMLQLSELITRLRERRGRFVPLGEHEFIMLTGEFLQRLTELADLAETGGNQVQVPPSAIQIIKEWTDEAASVQMDKHWMESLERFELAMQREFTLPAGLQAELRDYQVEGFAWLARLAGAGFGACLADDMGLGKTLQALALLLHRPGPGPALVVAPTSVCFNWAEEARRFAPGLRFHLFGEGDRREQILRLEAGDVLVTSYTMLQIEEELFTGRSWSTVILDEAQAVKNAQTKRSESVMKLDAGFRLILTGTPVENRLAELWNLFNFINPGLLGRTLQRFNDCYAIPIERDKDKGAQKRLKRLVQPFILRRTKSQVLDELPSRTEIIQHVSMSPDEAGFYEVLRQQAMDNLAGAGTGGQAQIRILAEIMKLRRACCSPELVEPGVGIAGSKLARLAEIVAELRENRHRALVFSQFVDHLEIVRNWCDSNQISYQYLDGSTLPKDRQKRVEAFQNGGYDLFLISLRAGGTGLNLTAADYVIHLDPWWNPAVEDQASDRAHRLGQTRPVTIYRLVCKDTIEDKILVLHREKRDLASSLLEGSDLAGRITPEELLRLIREK